jgi:hypothetical protein
MENVKRRKRIKRLYEKVLFTKPNNAQQASPKVHEEQ